MMTDRSTSVQGLALAGALLATWITLRAARKGRRNDR